MKGLAIFFFIVCGIMFFLTIIVTFQTWIALFGEVGGTLFSIFVFPVAIIGAPIADLIIRDNWLALLSYLWYALTYGAYALALWLYSKAVTKEEERRVEKEYARRYLESIAHQDQDELDEN
jgi:hypothetical protein